MVRYYGHSAHQGPTGDRPVLGVGGDGVWASWWGHWAWELVMTLYHLTA